MEIKTKIFSFIKININPLKWIRGFFFAVFEFIKRNKNPLTWVRNFLCLIFDPQIRQAKSIKASADRANIKFSINPYFVSFFILITSILFVQHVSASDYIQAFVVGNPDTVLANILAMINPDVVDSETLNDTYAHKDIGIYFGLIGSFCNSSALGLFTVGFFWFGLKAGIDKMMGVSNASTLAKTGLFLTCIALSAPIPVNIHGHEVNKNILQYYFDKAIYQTVQIVDKVATKNMNEEISIPSYKVISPKNLRNDFTKIMNVYLLGYERSSSERLTDTVSIELIDDLYRIEFEMGGSKTTITTKSGIALNEQATLLGIDLLEKEKLFVKSYVEHMFNNAIKLGDKLTNIDFSYLEQQTGDIQDYENIRGLRVSFGDKYDTYCKNIYEYSLAGSDKKAIQRYFEIASVCASKAFLIEHYENDYYDIEDIYNKTYVLRDNRALMFGENTPVANYNQIVKYTQNVCKKGYFACAEAVQFASMHNAERDKKLGVLSIPVGIVNNVASKVYDASDRILKVKTFEQEPTRTIPFSDMVIDERALFNVDIKLHKTNNNELISDAFDLYDFNKIGIPSIGDVVGTITGGDISLYIERLLTCPSRTTEVYNGFKCNDMTTETLDFGVNQITTALKIKFATAVISAVPTKSKLNGGVAIGKAVGGRTTAGAVGVTSILLPSLMTNPTKDDPYFMHETAEKLIFASFLVAFYNADFASSLDTFANMQLAVGVGIIVLIFGIRIQMFLLFLSIITELIIDSKVLMLKVYTAIINDGVEGLADLFTEIVAKLCFLVFLVFMMINMSYIIDILLLSQFEAIFEVLAKMQGSIENILTTMPQLLLMIIEKVVVLLLIGQFITGLLQRILEQIKKI